MKQFETVPEIYTPTVADLDVARERFLEYEPRDLFYRAASELVDLALTNKTKITVVEALAVLLQTWNAAYYRYHPFTQQHFADIENLLETHLDQVLGFRNRDILSVGKIDLPIIENVFDNFERVLGPVGAAKSLHLLTPTFFPLWDREIAKAYHCELGPVGTNAVNYCTFLLTITMQVHNLSPNMPDEANLLKRIDEYNYCKHTKKWM